MEAKGKFHFIIPFLFMTYLTAGMTAAAVSLEKPCAETDINCWINQLQSKELHDREWAVGHLASLYYKDKSETAKDAVINFLEKEAEQKFVGGAFITDNEGEGEAEFFYHLCTIVGNFRDPKAIPILLEIGHLDALKPYGESVLDIIIARLDHKNYGQRLAATRVLNDFLTPKEKGYTAEGEARKKIRAALLKATKDEHEFVRGGAALALGNFQDDEVIAVLKDIKNNDPYYHLGKNVKTGEKDIKRYTVREAAEKALEKIKKEKGR